MLRFMAVTKPHPIPPGGAGDRPGMCSWSWDWPHPTPGSEGVHPEHRMCQALWNPRHARPAWKLIMAEAALPPSKGSFWLGFLSGV